jgi:hypothetical protein
METHTAHNPCDQADPERDEIVLISLFSIAKPT